MRKKLHEFVKFGLVGCLAMAIHYGVYYFLLKFLSPNFAFTIGYILSLSVNFTLSAFFTFKVKLTLSRLLKFGISHTLNYILQICLLNVFLHFGVSDKLSPIPVYAISVPVSFLLVRLAMKGKKETYKDNVIG